ncbi:MAG: toll/interleukin-1 receptor domain-containing protein [Cyanobacteria bacterium P01_D01_bin.156]
MPHVFISYVREEIQTVKRLRDALQAYDVEVWLDKDQLKPGYRWADAIREAISEGAFFIACFSNAYNERIKSYMNEELTLAIDELRQRPTNQAWFIPVLLDQCEVPNRSIGGGETFRSIQQVKLYENWNEEISRILSVVNPDSAKIHELITALDDSSARVRIQAANTLKDLGSLARRAVPALVQALKDENWTVQAVAADTLGRIGLDSDHDARYVVQALRKVAKNGEFYAKRHANWALARLARDLDFPEEEQSVC